MTDLVKRLRRGVDTNEPPDNTDRYMDLAADEIERLQAALQDGEPSPIDSLYWPPSALSAIKTQRNAALEEAAKVVENTDTGGWEIEIAAAIRALKSPARE